MSYELKYSKTTTAQGEDFIVLVVISDRIMGTVSEDSGEVNFICLYAPR